MRSLLSLLLLVGISSAAGAQAIQRIEITEAGIYTKRVIDVQSAPRTATGNVQIATDFKLVQATTAVPARLGVTFGFRYKVVGRPGASSKLKVVLLIPQPGIRNPDTGNTFVRDESDWDRKAQSTSLHYYSFDNSWEIVAGTWTFEIWSGNRKLATQNFEVAPP